MNECSRGRIVESLRNVERWVRDHHYRGYEPFDGLSSYLRPLTFRSLFLDRVLMQLVRRSPVNLRPFLGIKPLDSTIGRGYMGWGYATMFKVTGEQRYAQKVRDCLDWLVRNRSPGYREFCWGKHFDFASRGGRYPKLEPITVWTSLVGMAFLQAYETLGDPRYLEVAESVSRWIQSLARSEREGGVSLSYTATGEPSSIHNHGMVAAAVLARTAVHAPNSSFVALARGIVSYSCARQLSTGAWYYGEDPMYHWIDNFHTGYNLDGLKCYIECTGDTEFEDSLRRGYTFYVDHFFERSGRPRYYHDRTHPVDSQCASQSIDTLTGFAGRDARALPLAISVAEWTIRNMQHRDGHFYYRQYRLMKAKTPMLHWAQTTMYKALACLYAALSD